jgi:hypothetical protein
MVSGSPPHQIFGSVLWGEIIPNAAAIDKYFGVVPVKYSVFYPYGVYELNGLYNKFHMSVITDDVMCVHWFNGVAMSKDYIHTRQFNKIMGCSMTAILKVICSKHYQ